MRRFAVLALCGGFLGAAEKAPLPASFPQGDYAPFGYLDNPQHSAVLNRSGVIRTVPPLGFGYWARRLPWPYGEGALRRVNYLSFLHLSLVIDGTRFHSSRDFEDHNVTLVSRYHTKNMTSYDWEFGGLSFAVRYFLATPDSLVCMLDVYNSGLQAKKVTLHATNIYGYPEERWWGSDGVAAKFTDEGGLAKIWAYGDVFAVGADRKGVAGKATSSQDEWDRWITENSFASNPGATVRMPGPMYTVQTYELAVPGGDGDAIVIGMARGVNEKATLKTLRNSLATAPAALRVRLAEDEAFYRYAPVPTGDWPAEWKHGWIYDLETLRMTIRPPAGIYKHPWDGMQIFTPRSVLGESLLDAMAVSYADVRLAKSVILGTFADAPAPNVPCAREDGSMNMICADGSEAGTAPTWGMPFHVIRSIYVRDRDGEWIKALYPHLKNFLEWWLKNRTDKDGWFHSKCSWESGQDSSKRFLVDSRDPGAVSDFVRTVDIEAAMAEAMNNMALFAKVAGRPQDREYWRKLADRRIATTRAMYVDGWFRDFDARNNKPIILQNYWDVMMLYPVAAGIATEEQMKAIQPRFDYFARNPLFWLEWPSFMLPFTEAAWNSGLRQFIGEVVYDTGSRIYPRIDVRRTKNIAPFKTTLPERYAYRIPGVSNEFWPIREDNPGGCENYGWGATLPTLVIRNIIGFREFDDPARNEFRLAPALPPPLLRPGKTYGMTHLNFRRTHTDVSYLVTGTGELSVSLQTRGARTLTIKDDQGKVIARGDAASLRFPAQNSMVYSVGLN